MKTVKKLEQSDLIKPLNKRCNKGISLFSGFDIYRTFVSKEMKLMELDFNVFLPTKNKNLQRDCIWTVEQKRELILSIIKRIFIPKITVVTKRGDRYNTFKVVDGKQRITTFIEFMTGKFGLVHNGIEYFYDDLADSLKMEINTYTFDADEYYEYDDEPFKDDELIQLFRYVNFSGTPIDKQHLENLES